MRRIWQSAMARLARSAGWKSFMQDRRAATALASRYVGGETAQEAIETAKALERQGIRASLFYLGEFVDRPELVAENVAAKLDICERLSHTGLDLHVSVDPTQVGCSIDWDMGARNAALIGARIQAAANGRPGVNCMMLDMEDLPVNAATIALHDRLRAVGVPMAQTLQAYLYKTEADIAAKIAEGARVRLVKGAMLAPAGAAFTGRAAIRRNYMRLTEMMLAPAAREAGFYPIIATHDQNLHEFAIDLARRNGWPQGSYEFEMLYGARNDVARALARRGERIRLYLPFGRDWWPYAVRRIGENPKNVVLLARGIIGGR
ncbi:MAG: proline dehydrogenase family protein [Hyphomicrobiaceae bacterium]|nr:proline dehydrogenase family protein [Hyphomicrobiaceae bacterium]